MTPCYFFFFFLAAFLAGVFLGAAFLAGFFLGAIFSPPPWSSHGQGEDLSRTEDRPLSRAKRGPALGYSRMVLGEVPKMVWALRRR